MRFAVVLNEKAGTLLEQPIEEARQRIRERFADGGIDAHVVTATGERLSAALAEACAAEADAVVVGGGDGTMASAAERLVGGDTSLGVLPLGTMNLPAKDLAMPLDLDEAIDALAHNRRHRIDVGEVNGRPFLSHAVLGAYPYIVEERERIRGRTGIGKWPAMAVAMFKAFRNSPTLDVMMSLPDGSSERLKTRALAVSNNLYDAELGSFLHRSRLDRGVLGVYMTRGDQAWRLAQLAVGMAVGWFEQGEGVQILKVREVTIATPRTRRLRLSNDGEVVRMGSPLVFRIRQGALPVLIPPYYDISPSDTGGTGDAT